MGKDTREEAVHRSVAARRAVALVALAVGLGSEHRGARADPIETFPGPGNGVLVQCSRGPGVLAMVGEVVGVGILGAERLATFPDYGAIRGNEPELGQGRVGLVGVHPCRPLAFSLRADFSEVLRIDNEQFRDRPIAAVDRVLDDAAVWWTPRDWASFVVGRHRVPFSRFRQLERALLTAGAVPFLVDRVAPDRRWGATFLGDLGAISYAVGGFADADELELRTGPDDPSTSGRALVAAHVEWTPRAPIGLDHAATPRSDPWYPVARLSLGAGMLYRTRATGPGDRVDLSLSGQVKYGRYAALAELLLAADPAALSIGGSGEASALFLDKVVVFARGDYDVAADLWSMGGGASYFVTPDRRNKVGLLGWVRRDTEPGGVRRDGVIAQLQASL